MTVSSHALKCHQVSKSFGPVKALASVSLHVAPGELVALLGPNGAGKSTLFQILTGLFVADSGEVEVLGADMARNPVAALAHRIDWSVGRRTGRLDRVHVVAA